MPWMIFVILLTLLDKLSSEVACIRLADIYWNITNPIFRIDNTDHIIDVNKGNVPFEYDQVNIICPVYPHHGTSPEGGDEEAETYIIYNVSKEEYDSCRITNPNPRIIAVCDNPHQLRYFTITFRSFTPQPGGLEFLPGHDYYFVSTSTGDKEGLHQLVGGRCATHNMKVIFKVCCSSDKVTPSGSSRNQPTIPESSASQAPEVTAEIGLYPLSSTSRTLDEGDIEDDSSSSSSINKPYHKNSLYPPRHHPYPFSVATSRPTMATGQMAGSTTPRWYRRPLFPSRVTPLTKQQLPYDEVPIEDEMARPHENIAGMDQLPNKARSKDEDAVSVSSTKSSCGPCLTCHRIHHLDIRAFISTCLVFHLLLTLLWR